MKEKRANNKTIKKLKELEQIEELNYDELDNTKAIKTFNLKYDNLEKNNRRKKMSKVINCLMVIIILFSIFFLVWWNYKEVMYNSSNIIKKLELVEFDEKEELITLNIHIKENKRYENIACNYEKENETFKKQENNICQITTSKENLKEIYLKNKNILLNPYKIESLILKANFKNIDKIYLAKNDSTNINHEIIYIGKKQDVTYKILNEEIIELKDNKITAKKEGTTKLQLLIEKEVYDEIDIEVTNLIIKAPKHFNYKKSYLACNEYSKEEAQKLDDILFNRINNAGYKTRAGVVAAARFLSLEFPYRIDYFFENGRINSSGVNYADGEGRYYKRGLYLHKDKFKDIKYTYAGPAIWGCPLTNYEDFGKYVYGNKMPNGLDCSGFVTWTLINGGFDVGDYGAGETYEPNQMTDLGERVKLTKDFVDEDKIKVGDLLNWWGHIAIIIGIDDTKYYVAESLDTYEGLVVKEYKKSTLHDDWTFVMLMDSVYNEDGNITNMWY